MKQKDAHHNVMSVLTGHAMSGFKCEFFVNIRFLHHMGRGTPEQHRQVPGI